VTKRYLTFLPHEGISIILILSVLFSATFLNLQVSLRRSRDAQRKGDLRSIAGSLEKFQAEFAFFPFDKDNKIAACVEPNFDPKSLGPTDPIPFVACQFGEDALRDVTDPSYPAYMEKLPVDPKSRDGISYTYVSNGRRFQIFAYLEGGADDEEYKPEVVQRNIMCGTKVCNFAVAFSNTPIDKSLEEYENELRELEKKNGKE
jgi:hypothetical protein